MVEQDVAPTLGDLAPFPSLRSLFAYNPGPFNKSWGFNVGVRASRGSLLAFGDADVLCRALPTAVAAARAGAPVVRAFSTAIDLDEAESEMVRVRPLLPGRSQLRRGRARPHPIGRNPAAVRRARAVPAPVPGPARRLG